MGNVKFTHVVRTSMEELDVSTVQCCICPTTVAVTCTPSDKVHIDGCSESPPIVPRFGGRWIMGLEAGALDIGSEYS
jgi:hypothetical protein